MRNRKTSKSGTAAFASRRCALQSRQTALKAEQAALRADVRCLPKRPKAHLTVFLMAIEHDMQRFRERKRIERDISGALFVLDRFSYSVTLSS
jgi:hypothetical protein